VFKHEKQALQAVVVNDGLHLHAVVLVPPCWCRGSPGWGPA
jgi:hypothetical protein